MIASAELMDIAKEAKAVVQRVSTFIEAAFGKVSQSAIEDKGLNDLVSYVDKKAEEQLVEGLSLIFPRATFITEEGTIENKIGEYCWIIDPLDGTTNFLHGVPHFAVSVALIYEGEPIIGIIQDVMRSDCYFAVTQQGAFLNDIPIRVSQSASILQSVLGMGIPVQSIQVNG